MKGKNFKDLQGKPLFRWILDALLDVDAIDLVVINTDARSLLAEHGLVDSDRVTIRDRRPELCGDKVSMNLILEDDIKNVSADAYLMTHTTNPMLSSGSISRALETYDAATTEGRADSLFAVNKMQTRFYRADGSAVNHDPDNLIQTQDLEPWFEENSNLYIFSRASFERTRARIGKRPILFETPKIESFDIDTPDDWEIVRRVAAFA